MKTKVNEMKKPHVNLTSWDIQLSCLLSKFCYKFSDFVLVNTASCAKTCVANKMNFLPFFSVSCNLVRSDVLLHLHVKLIDVDLFSYFLCFHESFLSKSSVHSSE